MNKKRKYDYDVALSFAGEDRDYVEIVASVLREIGIYVFYDKYEQVDLWGKNLYTHLDDMYGIRAKYCVIFISKYYSEKLWTNHERDSAQSRAISSKEEYILPARFDDTRIPGIKNTQGYIDLRQIEPDELAYMIAKKINPKSNIDGMLIYLKSWLKDYEIYAKGKNVVFKCATEDYYGEFSLRLLLEMYEIDELERMFLLPALVPC